MNWPFKSKPSILNEAIWSVLASMKQYTPDSPEYPVLLDHLERLMKMQAEERRNRVSPDTAATVAGGILQVLGIVAYEQKHLMNQRALGFVINAAKSR